MANQKRWCIFYLDGTEFSYLDGDPKDAPGLGVLVIVQDHYKAGERPYLQHMTDYYVWLGDAWMGCDLFGLWEYLFVSKYDFEKVALAGKTDHRNVQFEDAGRKARELRDKWYDTGNL